MTRTASPAGIGWRGRAARVQVVALAVACTAGCASIEPPRAWEKQYLARPEMTFDANRLDARNAQHIYQSKEGAAGGFGVGGGGCGCN
jgi:hypothetical protein